MASLGEIVGWLSQSHLVGAPTVVFQRVHTDSRTVEPGDLFVALKGERFDANDHLAQAQSRGAVAAICHPLAGLDLQNFSRIEVADTKIALGELAAAWRCKFTLPVIAVTGSNGKTTVTQMVAAILAAQYPGDRSLATLGNFNNDIGVPLTLLRLRSSHRIAVVELGMNHPGEIAILAAMVKPTVALVNNAQREHLEFMQTVEAVAQENGAVVSALPPSGVAVFPADDLYAPVWRGLAGSKKLLEFALQPLAAESGLHCVQAVWSAGAWQVQASGLGMNLHFSLHIAGRHNVKNALAAAACSLAADVEPAAVIQGLEAFRPVKGRSNAQTILLNGHACTVVDDTYNANPDSVRAAIDVLAELPGPRLLVLGDMGEVGDEGPRFHADAGRYAQTSGIEHFTCIGPLAVSAGAAFEGAQHFSAMEPLIQSVRSDAARVASILVKGSRFMRMERVVEALHAA